MSLLDLALPRDITWNLIATSDDMLATHANRFPNAAWRSSLAVFAYVPDLSDLPEDFPDRALTFLKVVCSITSYSPGCQALPPAPTPPEATGYIGTDMLNQRGYQDALSVWRARVEELKRLEQSTFPCSGALVQVAVYPKDGDTTDVDQLAYFASFEPQKRDLVEAVTESGEALTQSKSALQVRKGVTATDSMEDLDVFMGANVNAGFGGAQVGVGVSGQWGTIKKSGTESVDITNTDTSREAREQASHTTSLSQLYHLLDSYHLGTNRAEFFLQSRPHTVQQKDRFTFIDGPQDIEGIQEFFLVVSHPKDKVIVPTQDKPTADYCVDALLYTGHLDTYKLQASLTEPKTAESPWQELWLGYETPKKEGDDFPSLADLALAAEILFGVPIGADPVTIAAAASSDVGGVLGNKLSTWITGESPPPDANAPKPIDAPLIQPLVFQVPCTPGWRIDRTRGLGGYDLWENRDNRTATPLGEFDKEKTGKPQASIDILSKGSFSDPENYRPDSLLKLTVYVWPPNDPGKSFYHGRIKVYFIRDDTPSNGRAVPMFVTARGVSSCGTSPFAQFYGSAESGQVPDIAKETTIQVPWVAPWRSPQVGLPQAAMPSSSADAAPTSSVSAVAINSSAPSGLDQTAIASSRAKMVNAAGSQVRAKLRAMLTCPPRRFMHFHETDLVYSRLAAAAMTAEIRQLPAAGEHARELRNYVGSYSAPSTVAPVSRPAYQLPGGSGGGPAKPLPKATAFPALTLAGRGLSHADRDALHAAGIYSGLDLVDIPVSELAERLGTDEDRAHQIRLRAIGVTHIGASSSTGDSPRADM